jgi:hypothetical protein
MRGGKTIGRKSCGCSGYGLSKKKRQPRFERQIVAFENRSRLPTV